MIKIFTAKDKDFSSAGEIIIDPLKCIETKKKSLNGWYIDVEVSIKYNEYIKKDNICAIKTKSKLNLQGFRINENIERSARKIKFRAEHVMFDTRDYILEDVRAVNLNGINTLNYINSRADNITPFSFYSNVESVNTAYFIRKNLLEAMEIIEERWNGVFDADNWNINFLKKVGNDNGENIIYGKNLEGLEIFEDWTNVVTKILPVGYDGIILPEIYLNSEFQYEKPYTRVISFESDLDVNTVTRNELVLELREKAKKYLEENKYPLLSYTIISNINDRLEIGDIIQVLHPIVNIKTEVIEYEFDVIKEKVIRLNFGNFTRDVKSKFDNIKNTIQKINELVSKQEIIISNQSKLINTLNKNGYVYIDDNEILILDKLPKQEAKNVWRFGLGGLAFSSNGYEGPFETAITMDGSINASFITTGVMSASRIEGLAEQLVVITEKQTDQEYKLTQYQQDLQHVNINIQNATGINEIRNSNGKAGLDKNMICENVAIEEFLDTVRNTVSKTSFKISGGFLKFDRIYCPEGDYTLAFKTLRKANTVPKVIINGIEYDFDQTEINVFTENIINIDNVVGFIDIILKTDEEYCLFSDVMLNSGTEKLNWSMAVGEILSQNYSFTQDSFQIKSNDKKTKLEAKADEIAISNTETNEIQVTFNKDNTIINRLTIKQRLNVGSLRHTVLENRDVMKTFDD